MKNLARWYSDENQGIEPWIWVEIGPEMTAQRQHAIKKMHLLKEYLFVAEDADSYGNFYASNDLDDLLAYCDAAYEDDYNYVMCLESRGLGLGL